jgi:hypothetical protein
LGQREAARATLDGLISGPPFAERQEAQRLLESL